jgi:hypothetical protein
MSIEHTARHGADAGYEVVVASDGTSTVSDEWQHAALNYAMNNVGKVATAARSRRRSGRERPCRPTSLLRAGYIDGEWVDADSGATFAVVNPATGEVDREVPRMGAAETRARIDARAAGAAGLARMLAKERARSCAAGPTS